ncbi:flagellar hook-associated protein FlgL [Alcaligenaceae bacterium]|nr:flagellar hook-associated protein FlgL [Alcaligenaceae bacterium]
MRISSSLFFQTGLNSINRQQADFLHLYQQLGSGQRMVTPADDPLAAAQAINLSQSLSLSRRYAENRAIAQRNLGMEENALSSAVLQLQDVKTRLTEAGNGTLTDNDRATLANVLRNARISLLGVANVTDGNGQYVFSGSRGDVEPFQLTDTGTVVYRGDTRQRYIQADPTRQVAGSDVGTDVFSRAVPGTHAYLTSADAQNRGTGVISSPQISDPSGGNIGSRFVIGFTSASIYTVWVDGLEVTQNQPFDAGSGRPLVLPGGVQVSLRGAPVAGDTFTVEPADTVDINLFETLGSVVEALEAWVEIGGVDATAFRNRLISASQRIDENYNNILTVRASVGARMNELDALEASGNQQQLGYRQRMSDLQDLDYYTASTQLQLRLSALEAAAEAYRKIQASNLFTMGSK